MIKKLSVCLLGYVLVSQLMVTPSLAATQTYSSEYLNMQTEYNDAEYQESGFPAPRVSYKMSSSKSLRNRTCKCSGLAGKDFQCYGWVNIVDKVSGTDLDHSTTAAVSSELDPSGEYYGAVKEIGSGKVSATSEWVHGYDVKRIFWGWVH